MNIKTEIYELTQTDKKSNSKKLLRKIHQNELEHFVPALKRLLLEDFKGCSSEIFIKIKKFKNGKHTLYFDKIQSSSLRNEVRCFVNNSFPIVG